MSAKADEGEWQHVSNRKSKRKSRAQQPHAQSAAKGESKQPMTLSTARVKQATKPTAANTAGPGTADSKLVPHNQHAGVFGWLPKHPIRHIADFLACNEYGRFAVTCKATHCLRSRSHSSVVAERNGDSGQRGADGSEATYLVRMLAP